jgi:hypothetical protein
MMETLIKQLLHLPQRRIISLRATRIVTGNRCRLHTLLKDLRDKRASLMCESNGMRVRLPLSIGPRERNARPASRRLAASIVAADSIRNDQSRPRVDSCNRIKKRTDDAARKNGIARANESRGRLSPPR